jgi:integrase
MLRHACGYALANKGINTRTLQAYLGHRSNQFDHALCGGTSGLLNAPA